jgi:hypothetical protein
MPHLSRAELGHAFCSYCGYPPCGRRARASADCAHCHFGNIVHTTPGAVPRCDEPFLIVDERLRVHALSLQAEAVLLAADADGFGAPLASYLIADDGCDPYGAQLTLRLTFAVGGRSVPGPLKLRTASEPELRFTGRVSSCGPPAGALLVLTPVDGHERDFDAVEGQQGSSATENMASVTVLVPRDPRRRWAS